jgi:hypothetical protein
MVKKDSWSGGVSVDGGWLLRKEKAPEGTLLQFDKYTALICVR